MHTARRAAIFLTHKPISRAMTASIRFNYSHLNTPIRLLSSKPIAEDHSITLGAALRQCHKILASYAARKTGNVLTHFTKTENLEKHPELVKALTKPGMQLLTVAAKTNPEMKKAILAWAASLSTDDAANKAANGILQKKLTGILARLYDFHNKKTSDILANFVAGLLVLLAAQALGLGGENTPKGTSIEDRMLTDSETALSEAYAAIPHTPKAASTPTSQADKPDTVASPVSSVSITPEKSTGTPDKTVTDTGTVVPIGDTTSETWINSAYNTVLSIRGALASALAGQNPKGTLSAGIDSTTDKKDNNGTPELR